MKNKIKVKNKILLISLAVVLALSLSIVGCEGEGGPEFNLSMATIHPAESPFNKVSEAWADWIYEESDGRVKITVYPAEQLAPATGCYDAAYNGTCDIACQLVPFNPERWPLTEVGLLPLIFEYPGCRAATLTMNALYDKYPEIQAEYSGVKVLGFHTNAPMHIHMTDKPVHNMTDLAGEVIDSAGTWGFAAIEALGGTPTTMFPGERYDALAKGDLDGCASTEWEGHISWNNLDVCDYSTEVGLNLFIMLHVMNMSTWNSLPSDLQALFEGENRDTYFEVMGYVFDVIDIEARETVDQTYKDRGKEGIYVLPPAEKANWVAAVMPVRELWLDAAAAIVGNETAHAILDDCIAFAGNYSGYPEDECPECADILHDWGYPGY